MNHASSYASRATPVRRQQGNTLVGIIIGLVIGLGIAVVVALVITKGSSPFTDKSGRAGKAAEPTAGQIADPNKPMYGNKEAAKEAARDFSKEPREIGAPTQPAAPAPAPATAQQPKAPPPDALQELIGTLKDKPAPKAPAAAPAPQAKAETKGDAKAPMQPATNGFIICRLAPSMTCRTPKARAANWRCWASKRPSATAAPMPACCTACASGRSTSSTP